MAHDTEIRLRIDAWTPETLPMARLAEYLAYFAAVLGERERVHFVAVEPGSAVLAVSAEITAVPKVRDRLKAVQERRAPPDVLLAFDRLDSLMAVDNAVGSVTVGIDTATVLQFQGRDRPKPLRYGPIIQAGTIEGMLVKVGGIDSTVPVHIETEQKAKGEEKDNIVICSTNRAMARRLAPHLYHGTLRLSGEGRWFREEAGNWALDRFTIASFEPLDDTPLADLMDQMSRAEGNGWDGFDDPLNELNKIRHGDEVN
jgi:hypothetical protein